MQKILLGSDRGTSSPPSLSWLISKGILTVASGLGGSNQAHIRWDMPTVAAMPDLQCCDIDLGTSPGNYDILSATNLSTTLQPGANEILITGLLPSTTYYWRVRNRDSEENLGSYCAEQTVTSEAAWVAPTSPTLIGQSDFPYTMSGNAKLSENIVVASGTAINAASNATLDLAGFSVTVATSGAGRALLFGGGGITNCVVFDSVGGGAFLTGSQASSECVEIISTLGTGNILKDFRLEYDGLTSYCVNGSSGSDLTGMRAVNMTWNCYGQDSADTSANSGGVQRCDGLLIHGGIVNIVSDDDRTYFVEDGKIDIWGMAATIAVNLRATAKNHGFHVKRSGGETYTHDNSITVTANGSRNLFFDGSGGNARANWNTLNMSGVVSTETCSGFHVRQDSSSAGTIKNVAIGFNTINMGSNSQVSGGVIFSGSSTSSATPSWTTAYEYHNSYNDVAAGNAYLFSRGHNLGYHWGSTFNKATGYSGDIGGWGTSGNDSNVDNHEYFNDIVINGSGDPDIDAPATALDRIFWHAFNSWTVGGEADDDSRITYEPSWTGYDPNSGTPPTPSGMTTISGVM